MGKVGGEVTRRATAEGAEVAVADLHEDVAADLANQIGAELIALDAAYAQPCDVLSPNALGGVLNDVTIPKLRCRIVCGGANNQLQRDPADAELLSRTRDRVCAGHRVCAGLRRERWRRHRGRFDYGVGSTASEQPCWSC